jgi:hypothetical protein
MQTPTLTTPPVVNIPSNALVAPAPQTTQAMGGTPVVIDQVTLQQLMAKAQQPPKKSLLSRATGMVTWPFKQLGKLLKGLVGQVGRVGAATIDKLAGFFKKESKAPVGQPTNIIVDPTTGVAAPVVASVA